MKRQTRGWIGTWLAPLALVLVLAGCEGSGPAAPEEGGRPDPVALLETGIHPVLAVTPAGAGLWKVELALKRVGEVPLVSAFNLELAFSAERATVHTGTLASGLLGAWNEVEPGRVRVAAAALEGLGPSAVLELRLAAAEAPRAEWFTVEFQEVVGGASYGTLRGFLSMRPHPVVTRNALP